MRMVYLIVTAMWTLAALAAVIATLRSMALTVIPIAIVLWYAAHAERVKQSTQLVLPVLLLPGALMCFVGMMQAFGYGRMQDEPMALNVNARIAFFSVGLLLHFAAYYLLANESRASDHPSGTRATKI
jgi:hypothetical protein